MSAALVAPPLNGALTAIRQVSNEATTASPQSSSPCGSVRICRQAANRPRDDNDLPSEAVGLDDICAGPHTFVLPTSPVPGPEFAVRCVPSGYDRSGEDNGLDDPEAEQAAPARESASTVPSESPDSPQAPAPAGQPRSRLGRPFHKWVRTLHRRRAERRRLDPPGSDSRTSTLFGGPGVSGSSYCRQSSSVSSLAYVSAVRDASVSAFGTSIVASSRNQTRRSSKVLSKTDRSSRISNSVMRSEDDNARDRPQSHTDPAILERSKQRRRVIEELIETEEGYIGDIKFLMSAYMTIFASSPSSDASLRLSMYSSLTEIVELHDQILGELQQAVPYSEYARILPLRPSHGPPAFQRRDMRDLEVVPKDKAEGPACEMTELTADPKTAAAVAQVFMNKMSCFFIYKEYGAKLEMVSDDLKTAYRSMPNWDRHQRGLESLASCLSYARDGLHLKRALSIDDLLAKPIQRACRYALLFGELLKSTPVIDCPRAHSDIETVMHQLQELAEAMNKAKDDPLVKTALEKTWILQDRLQFPSQPPAGASKSRIRSFGRIELCGVLYVCWQTKASVKGSYMICVLYHDWLCLAVAERSSGKSYTLQACLPLSRCSLEEADNGKGLQCHQTPFTWKLAFECGHRLYEILMTAGTQKEEFEWRKKLDGRAVYGAPALNEGLTFHFLNLDIKSLGVALGIPSQLARRVSIRRATTVLSKPQLCQVILKHTAFEKDETRPSHKHVNVSRSQSLQDNSRIPILAPSRADRVRLEAAISDVWTRDILFSGQPGRAKGDRLIRPSASSMMRRISMVSLSGTFGRRSVSRATAHKAAMHTDAGAFRSAPSPIFVPASDYGAEASYGFTQLEKHHEAGQAEITVLERSRDHGDASLEIDDAAAHYRLAGRTELSDGPLQGEADPAKSTASIPRRPVTQPMDESGQGESQMNEPRTGDQPPVRFLEPSFFGIERPRSTEALSVSSSTFKMMPPLTHQPCRAASAKSARHWLGKPILRRGSFRRSFKKMQRHAVPGHLP